MKPIIASILILVISLAIGCSKSSGSPGTDPQQSPGAGGCDGINASFTADILPIIQNSCAIGAGCHGNGSTNGPGRLSNFAEVKDAASDIKRVVNIGSMPKNGSLTSLQIKQITCWVDNGRINN